MAPALDSMAAKRGAPLFVPLLFRLALRLEQVDWEDALVDAPLVAHALQSSQRLFGADAGVSWFDGWLEAEAAGARVARGTGGEVLAGSVEPPVRLPEAGDWVAAPAIAHVLAITRQLVQTSSGRAVIGTITGPSTLLGRLLGEERARAVAAELAGPDIGAEARAAIDRCAAISTALAREYCEAGVGALALLEDEVPLSPALVLRFDALFNLASYFGVPVMVVSRAPLAGALAGSYAGLGARYLVSPAGTDPRVLAFAPAAIAADGESAVRAPSGIELIATTWEIPAATAPEGLLTWKARLDA